MRTGSRLTASMLAVMMQAPFGAAAFGQSRPAAPSAPALQQQSSQPSTDASAGAADMAPSSKADQQSDVPVLYVTSIEVIRTANEPKVAVIRVTGLAASKGWSSPQLVPTSVRAATDGILDLQLIATPPDQTEEADGFEPIDAVLVLDAGDPYKGVRVRGSGNSVETAVPGSKTVAVTANDCHDCIGKKLASDPNAPAGQQGALRREDFPKELRVISPSSGVGSGLGDPNRLTLLLGEDNAIVEAFWE